mgnify:FL=1|jgi:hypothetical protein|nr:MAG TPA: hypothetical protein [Caudoviricetes sp.]
MNEIVNFNLTIVFKSGRILNLIIGDVELDWLFDTCFKRSEGNFLNLGSCEVINVNEIEYFTYKEILKDE